MKKVGLVALLAFVALVAFAADAPKPEVKPMTDAAFNKLLKAQHSLDEIRSQEAQMSSQFLQLKSQMDGLQAQYPVFQKKDADAAKALEDAKAQAVKDAGLDAAKFDVDMAKGEFSPKAEPVPSTASPAKK